MKKEKPLSEEMLTFDGKDFIEDVKKLLNSNDISEDVISSILGYFQQQNDFSRLAAMKDQPGEYRKFLSKIILNLPISYANHKIDEIINGLKVNFKLSEGDSQVIFAKAVEMSKSRGIADILDKYAETVVNEQTVPDDKIPPFKVIDPNERGLKIVKDEVTLH